MTAEEKARIFNKAYKEHKYHIAEAEEAYFTSGIREIFENSQYTNNKIHIPYDIFRNPAVTIMSKYNAFEYMGKIEARRELNSISGKLYGLNQWAHYGKEVFDFDYDLSFQLIDDAKDFDLDEPMPVEILDKIPGQGFFISTPPIKMTNDFYVDGFFVNKGVAIHFVATDAGEKLGERLVMSEAMTFTAVMFENGLIKHTFSIEQPLNIEGIRTLQDALDCMIKITELRTHEGENKGRTKRTERILKIFYEFLLYLCAENADIRSTTIPSEPREGAKPDKKKNKAPSIKEVGKEEGVRIKQLKAKTYRSSHTSYEPGSPKKEKSPHSRRSHWHHHWVGKHGTEERRLVLYWQPPSYIHAEKMGEANAAITRLSTESEK